MLYQTHPPLFIPIPSLSPFTCSILSSTSTSPLSLLPLSLSSSSALLLPTLPSPTGWN
ncbi:hypothetical protein FF1_027005 [Malus domestica]